MVGICSYGGYVPRYRLDRRVIYQTTGWINAANISNARGEKAVANFDEDSITLAVAAGIDALKGIDRSTVGGVYLCSTTLPYRERLNAGIVTAALGLPDQIRAADFSGGLKAGTTALLAALEGVEAKRVNNLLVTAAEFTPYPAEYYEKGVRVALTDFRQNPADPFCGHKTTCYGPRLTALKNAHEKLATEALWFTTENFLAEGSISNVFLVKDAALYTPPVQTPILPGIARKTVIEIAETENIPCHEQPLQIGDLLEADEVFLTNVIMEVLPVTSVEAHTVADAKPGEITKNIVIKYKERLNQ